MAARKLSAEAYIANAEQQLAYAAAETRGPESLIYSYRAALRAAGALIEWGMRDRKRRPTGSAWAKLRKVQPEFSEWADVFEAHARLASRAGMGLESEISEVVVRALYTDAVNFLSEVRGTVYSLPDVA
ncbi:hypothetical protein CFAL_04345 [Corynebacterium falsenii DSM 44353]|uniref:SAV-6107-like HEPN domain-containing protein n=1 Tax=Corynebacterium falsenii TaxID=108486 RepID=A0A418Q7M3_9CORY|nr:SAV_6107 family HEPN domain-containing protein [Corynebacterium falsenii]AHI02922.1 hypothetical protein CFAL_04345 [Corynebacterium falsenii DSM 44353]MDC7103685.1 SAV_6107 family HEPN domain-containing protein [Corynebacterium falsenii]RIX35259.1 hypothetical protein D3M95_05190 [Corynebacterium falsenii]UBI03634.1 hypothetical protein LA343_06250 [Corynebacterium falsenii]UBI06359.1 hypothetical protein LA329_08755 [Corynebacterium falsenii]